MGKCTLRWDRSLLASMVGSQESFYDCFPPPFPRSCRLLSTGGANAGRLMHGAKLARESLTITDPKAYMLIAGRLMHRAKLTIEASAITDQKACMFLQLLVVRPAAAIQAAEREPRVGLSR